MPQDEEFGREEWAVRVRVWLERAGLPVLGKGRLELLQAIDRGQSISAAARALGMSYRRAWLLVKSVNDAAGKTLVLAATGGMRGGGAIITPYGRHVLDVFDTLQAQVGREAVSHLQRILESGRRPEMVLFAAVSLEEAIERVLLEYKQRVPALGIRAIFGASDALADQLLAGASADVFISADLKQVNRLSEAGLVAPGSRILLAKNRLAGIGPASSRIPIRGPKGLAHPNVRSLALAEPRCPLGAYCRAYLNELGMYKKLASRIVFVDNSRAVVTAVCAGQADAGLAYASDAAQAIGSRLLFHARRPSVSITYEAALVTRDQESAAARGFLRFLQSTAARTHFRHFGLLQSKA